MALLDWATTNDTTPGTGLEIHTEVDFPEIGDGSLAMIHTGTTSYSHTNLWPVQTLPTTGVEPAGRIRTICRVDVHEGATPQTSYFGVTAMQSQNSLQGSGACYALLVTSGESLASPRLHLHRFNAGLTDGLTESSFVDIPFPGGITLGVPFTMELQWVVDVPGLGGAFLVGRTGTMTDFSDLTDQIATIDASPLLTSTTQGLVGSFKNNVAGSVKKVLFDNTTVYELI